MFTSILRPCCTFLTLFLLAGSAVAVAADTTPGTALPTLYVIGDSTVRNGQGTGTNQQWGWGDPLRELFDPAQITVLNRGHGGTSSRTFYTRGDWQRVRDALRPGDWVILQFGHNDSAKLNDDSRARGTIRGVGDEQEEIDNLLTKQREVVHTYGWYLRQYVAETRAKGASVIICSLIPRMIWKEGKIARSTENYAGWAAAVAKAEQVPFLDLNRIIADRYDALGPKAVEPFFVNEHTHTSRAGAEFNAAYVVAGIKTLAMQPLIAALSAKATSIAAAP